MAETCRFKNDVICCFKNILLLLSSMLFVVNDVFDCYFKDDVMVEVKKACVIHDLISFSDKSYKFL